MVHDVPSSCSLVSTPLVVPVASVKTLAVMLLSSGFYIPLFCLTVYLTTVVLTATNKRLHRTWLVALFFMSNLGATVRTAKYYVDQRELAIQSFCEVLDSNWVPGGGAVLATVYHLIFVLVNCISDSLIIYRLFVIWGRTRKVVVILSVTGAILLFCLGMVATIFTAVMRAHSSLRLAEISFNIGYGYNCANAAFNFLLTVTVAGRIWWIKRKSSAILSPATQKKYQTAIAILLESGLLYPITLITHAVLMFYYDTLPQKIDLAPFAIQMAGIAPTLIILRSTLNKSAESVPQVLSTLRFEERDPAVVNSNLDIEATVSSQQLPGKEGLGL